MSNIGKAIELVNNRDKLNKWTIEELFKLVHSRSDWTEEERAKIAHIEQSQKSDEYWADEMEALRERNTND